MSAHTAKKLFGLNIRSAEDCLELHHAIEGLGGSRFETSWLLRASVVFAVSSLDAYLHDKIRYRAGRFASKEKMPQAMEDFEIPIKDLSKWTAAVRKGNVLRNWLVAHFATIPLQKQEVISEALKMVGIDKLWATIEPNTPVRERLLAKMDQLIRRRNQISHEGDRMSSRKSGKRLRPINPKYAEDAVAFVKMLVDKIENAFPW